MSQSRLEEVSDGYDDPHEYGNSLFEGGGGIASGQGSDAEL